MATAQALREGMLLGAGFNAIEEGIVKDNPLPVLKMWCSHSIWGKHHRQRFKDSVANCTTDYFCQEWGEAEKSHLVNGEHLA